MVVPSRTEPFGLVAAEGQILGRPIVASDTGGLPEVIQNGVTGMLVPAMLLHGLTLTVGGRIDHWQIHDGHLVKQSIASGAVTRNELYSRR